MSPNKIFYFIAIIITGQLFFIATADVNKISAGNDVFLGEKDLDLTEIIDGPVMIGYYTDPCGILENAKNEELLESTKKSSGNGGGGGGYLSDGSHESANSENEDNGISGGHVSDVTYGCIPPEDVSPSDIQQIEDPKNFFVDPEIYSARTGEWYIWDGEKHGDLLFVVKEPSVSLKIIHGESGQDITGKEIDPGTYVNFLLSTNLMNVSKRTGFNSEDGYMSISVKQGKDGDIIFSLPVKDNLNSPLSYLPVDSEEWYWIGSGDDHSLPAMGDGWDTNNEAISPGEYWVWASIDLNGMNESYLAPDGTAYTGKTQTPVKIIKITGNLISPEKTINPSFVVGEGISGGTTN
jgi:hypothetical protein